MDGLDLTGALSEAEREALWAALEADDHEAASTLFGLAETRAPEAVNNPDGNEPELRKYWLTGEGGRRIGWRRKGAWLRCVEEVEATGAAKSLTSVKGYCATLYHSATGQWPGAGRKGKGKVASTSEAFAEEDHPRDEQGEFAPAEGAKDDGKGVKASTADTKKFQAQLNHLGYSIAIDGQEGPETRNAIRQFQADNDLPVTGELDKATTTQMVERPQRRSDVKPGANGKGAKAAPKKPAGKPASKPAAKAPAKPATKAPASKSPAQSKSDAAKSGVKAAAAAKGSKPVTKTSTPVAKKSGSTAPKKRTEGETDTLTGRVLEALDTSVDGRRRFAVEVIRAGDSKNKRRYPMPVLEAAAHLYEGAQAYDGHRDEGRLRSSSTEGLIGYLTNVTSGAGGLEAELSLLPSAARVAEAFDVALELAQSGRESPFVGLSHDVSAHFRPVTEAGGTVQEATQIVGVNSVDVVAVPAAGGRATRVLAGGEFDTDDPGNGAIEEEIVDLIQVAEALRSANPEDRATFVEALGQAVAEAAPELEPEPVVETVREADLSLPREHMVVRALVESKVAAAGLPAAVAESVRESLPARVVEADVDRQLAAFAAMRAQVERAGLAPTQVQVTQESRDKKVKALDAMFAGDFTEGYSSLRQAWADYTGARVMAWGEDVNRRILRESAGQYDSADRALEALDSTTWNTVLGDSITRRMVAEYQLPQLNNWRRIVSETGSLSDFRTNRRERLGGYGVLPTVNEGAPYQPLTSPGDEEVTYTIAKKGGTESITIEMIANDDLGGVRRIPAKLGRAAAHTVHRFVWDLIITNPTLWDSVALFHAAHANTGTTALSQSSLSAARLAMRSQAAYGSSLDILSIVPTLLVVPAALEEVAFQLSRSAVAMPSGAPTGAASDIPNIHQGMDYLVLDHLTDANNWYVLADPALCPTIEMGFLNGRDTPELFTQSDPSVGSMFNNDSVTYKIRYIFGGAVLEYRGMYGAIVA